MKIFHFKAFLALTWFPLGVVAIDSLVHLQSSLDNPFSGMKLDAIEASLLAMAKQGATPELLPFIQQIWNLTDRMTDAVKNQSNISQYELNVSWFEFLRCEMDDADAFNTLDQWNTTHRNCSIREAAKWKAWSTQKQQCDDANATATALCSSFAIIDHFPQPLVCNIPGGYAHTVPWMINLRDKYYKWWDEWTQARNACDTAAQTAETCYVSSDSLFQQYVNLTQHCNEKQWDLEYAACGQETVACQRYYQCYKEKKANWIAVNTSEAANEKAFLAEYHGILQIRCLLEAFKFSIQNDTDLNTGIEACRRINFNIPLYMSPLYIRYYDISGNPMKNCSINGVVLGIPGNPAWYQAYYAGLPAPTTFELACKADCCWRNVSGNLTASKDPTFAAAARLMLNGVGPEDTQFDF